MKRIVFYSFAFLIALILIGMIIPVSGPKRAGEKIQCELELTDINTALHNYQIQYGSYPTGNRAEIIKSLTGNNPRKIQFLFLNFNNLNSATEYLDPWRTPYTISFTSTNSSIISSAGPNKKFGDADDIIFNSTSNDFVKP
jgi:hypothetical protein